MGSSSAYQSLQELFPQVDVCILQAIATEHSPDRAVEVILFEVLPYMSVDPVPQEAPHSPRENRDVKDPSVGGGELENQRFLNHLQGVKEANAGPSKPISVASEDANETNSDICRESHQVQSCLNNSSLELENSSDTIQLVPSPVHEEMPDTAEYGLLSENDSGALVCACEKAGLKGSKIASEQEVFVTEMFDVQDKSTLTTTVNESGQFCRIDLPEDTIRDAKNNKETLFSVMDSVINLMREVELQKKAAEQAKEEAARGGLDILARVEDFKQMLRHAKEANDNHAGEVYGERSILTTEVWELQSHLLNLSDDRDKSLAIIDEMRQTLEARLVAAEEEWKAAEQEKLEKEKSARKALAKQELIMEKVVQESKKLQQEAEENSKLREFLMDRGCIVDILQGEIADICRDVKLLKQKFDERVPLSKSVSSTQTTCILASSSSSITSMAFDRVPEQSESLKKSSPTPSVDDRSQKSSSEEAGVRDDHKVLSDDDWDFLDDYAAIL